MSGVDAAVAAMQAAEAKIDAAIVVLGNLKTSVDSLTAALAAANNADPVLQAAADELTAHVGNLDAALNPPAPATP